MENKEYWLKEIDKCVDDIDYYYNNYVVTRNSIETNKKEEFKKQLDLKNSLYVPTEADKKLMYENLLITKFKDDTL